MIEVVFAVGVFVLAAGGLALGLALGRGPARTSCGAMACGKMERCAGCPHLREEAS